MRAADSKGPPPPPSPPLFSQLQANESPASVLDNPQYAYMKRYQESLMRVESSTMSDPSCGLHQRAALGEECLVEDAEQLKERRSSSREEEQEQRMTQSPPELLGAINLHMELATKKREVAHLVDEMQRLQSSINNFKEMSTSKISQLQDVVTEKDRIIKDLAEKLLRQQDYSDLKRELRLLKALDMGGWQSWSTEQNEAASPVNEKSDSPADTNGARMTPPSEDESVAECGGGGSGGIGDVSTEQLQRCLRLNVDRFCGESLNTLSISRCVRELLSVNNIGQRLFAKLVLGLSQGTVSELLSKPKPWDKLTEKGRDSYRKMHAWACDQHCVMMLKSLLPKKGREGSTKPDSDPPPHPDSSAAPTTTTAGSEDTPTTTTSGATTTVDVHHPLMPSHKDMRHHHLGGGHHPLYPELVNGGSKPPFGCHFGPEFPPVMLAHIYQEELLKLIGKRMKEGQPEEQAKQAQDEIRQALAIYHRELTLLAAQGSHHHPDPSCHACPMHRGARPELPPYCREQPPACCLPPHQQSAHEVQHAGSFFSPDALKVLSPYGGGGGGSPMIPIPPEGGQQGGGGEEASPLQRMQSITNSLLNQAAAPSFSTLPQRPMKAVLPPITQQQFDHYNNLNTEDIVKRVKEQLSQYSISQRLFGESVLGLSQGSVSDLLARPKPWHMLTQKGREPFIRMKMFLEDEGAVHKLVASQYKIAPERLMRMGGYGGVPLPPGSTRFSPVSSSEPSYPTHRQPPSKPSHPSSPQPPSAPESPSAPLTAHSPSGSAALPSSGNLKGALGRRGGGGRCLAPYVQPSVYEMAAVTTDLDTQVITARIKETLTVHNIGQKLFGEAVLGLSQGSVSELLSKPKPWHMLSIKGREPFIRMQLWLNDPANVEKLQAIKTERREANKRRRNAMEADGPSPLCEAPFPLEPLFLYPSSSKKPRILFSEEQKEALKLAFQLDPYPSTAVVEFLSAELGLSVRTITNWFHNHRMRLKQEPPPPGYPHQEAFDPIRFRLLLGQRLAEMCKQQVMPTFFGDNRMGQKLPPMDNTLDLSMSGGQHHKEDKEDDMDRGSTESVPTRTSSSSSSVPSSTTTAAIDLTPTASDKTPGVFGPRMSPLEYAAAAVAAAKDLSFATFQKMDHQISKDLVPEDSPVDLREDKRMSAAPSSSNRRKPAAPQWVDPGLDLSRDSDLCGYEEDEDDDLDAQVINGVCVRQTDFTTSGVGGLVDNNDPFKPEDDKSRLEREQNIRRLERAISEHEEQWDDISDDDDLGSRT